MHKKLLPTGMMRLKDTFGQEVEYVIPREILKFGYSYGPLEAILPSCAFRGGAEAHQKPYYIEQADNLLVHFFAGQLAIDNLCNTPLNDNADIAQYLAGEHVVAVPPRCSSKLVELQHKFQVAIHALDNWNNPEENTTLEDAISSLHEAVTPGFGIYTTEIKIPEVVILFNQFLTKYEVYRANREAPIVSHLDEVKREVQGSIQNTGNKSKAIIGTLSKDLRATIDKPSYDIFVPPLLKARLVDVFTLNHMRLFPKERQKTLLYKNAQNLYEQLTTFLPNKNDQLSAYASLIAYDLLLNSNPADHFIGMTKVDANHPKTVFIEKLLNNEKTLWDETSKLALVGLEQHHHNDILDIILKRLSSYIEDQKQISPFPVDIMTDFVKYCSKIKHHATYFLQNSRGDQLWCLEFNRNPYLEFKNVVYAEQKEDKYLIYIPTKPNNQSLKSNISDYLPKTLLFGRPSITSLFATTIDEYLAKDWVFLKRPGPGDRWKVISA